MGFERLFFRKDIEVNCVYVVIIELFKFLFKVVLFILIVCRFIKLVKLFGMGLVILLVLRLRLVKFMFFKYDGMFWVKWFVNSNSVCNDLDL